MSAARERRPLWSLLKARMRNDEGGRALHAGESIADRPLRGKLPPLQSSSTPQSSVSPFFGWPRKVHPAPIEEPPSNPQLSPGKAVHPPPVEEAPPSKPQLSRDAPLVDLIKARGQAHTADCCFDVWLHATTNLSTAAPIAALSQPENIIAYTYYDDAPISVAEGVKLFDILDENHDGIITRDEIATRMTQARAEAFREKYAMLEYLQDADTVAEMLEAYCGPRADKYATIDMGSWFQLLGALIEQECLHMARRGILEGRVFWGLDMSVKSDFVFFLNNHHPIVRAAFLNVHSMPV